MRIDLSRSARDESLEEAFARGDASAYDAAYRAFGARMYTTALRLLRDPGTARECVHDVLLHLWKRKRAYDRRRGGLEAFLVTCVRNQALTRMRTDLRRLQLTARLDPPQPYTMEDDPIERERIARALSRLPEEQGDAVRLAYYRGLTLAQIATECNVPLGTVKSRLSSALRTLRLALVTGNGS